MRTPGPKLRLVVSSRPKNSISIAKLDVLDVKPENSIMELKTLKESNDISQTELACYNRFQNENQNEIVSDALIHKNLTQQSEA